MTKTLVACALAWSFVLPASVLAAVESDSDTRSLVREGAALARSNKNEQAEQVLRQAITNSPDSSDAHYTLALVLAKLSKMDEAIAEMKTAVDLSGRSESSLLALGGLYQSNGNIAEAINAYADFAERFPKSGMYKKTTSLIESLKSELERRTQRSTQDAMLPWRDPAPGTGKPASNDNDDYLGAMQEKSGMKRWSKSRLPVTVYIADGSRTEGFRDSYKAILLKSFDDWTKASGGLVKFVFTRSADDALLQCSWTSNQPNKLAEAGDARVFMDQDYICKAEILFLTLAGPGNSALTDNQFRQLSLHEIGHALGLSGHTTNPADIMFYSATYEDKWRELSGRDSRSITRLYKSDL